MPLSHTISNSALQSGVAQACCLVLVSLFAFPANASAGETYVGAFGGIDLRARDPWSRYDYKGRVHRREGPTVGGRIGHVVAENSKGQIRVEAELAHRRNKVTTVDSVIFSNTGTTGRVSALSAMGNIYFDLGAIDASVRPFLGGGVGLSRLNHRTRENAAWLVAVDYVQNVEASASLLAWQVMGGASARLGDKARLTLEGRYQQTAAGTLKASGSPVYKTERRGVSLLVGVNFGL